ncbi:hypothetical protein O181_024638 [Austropuccinia psidii MF-1]|uniref:Integrase catalytic domain-containing protein n=1 Tax=Austropuccinia psidii MF-1 TaxID=1389203 RepID=A0A9Q3CJ97_9BASI|nr:hypothetical protein [Austropuccinia psidii MF-1]
MLQIQEPKNPWEMVHMDLVAVLLPGGDRSFNSFLVLVERYTKNPMLLPCPKEETAIDTAIMIWNEVIIQIGIFQNMISDRDPKFTSSLCKYIHNLLGAKLSFLTDYHPQADDLAERIIQKRRSYQNILCLCTKIQRI